jgi:hypothetical protein
MDTVETASEAAAERSKRLDSLANRMAAYAAHKENVGHALVVAMFALVTLVTSADVRKLFDLVDWQISLKVTIATLLAVVPWAYLHRYCLHQFKMKRIATAYVDCLNVYLTKTAGPTVPRPYKTIGKCWRFRSRLRAPMGLRRRIDLWLYPLRGSASTAARDLPDDVAIHIRHASQKPHDSEKVMAKASILALVVALGVIVFQIAFRDPASTATKEGIRLGRHPGEPAIGFAHGVGRATRMRPVDRHPPVHGGADQELQPDIDLPPLGLRGLQGRRHLCAHILVARRMAADEGQLHRVSAGHSERLAGDGMNKVENLIASVDRGMNGGKIAHRGLLQT